MEEEEVAKSRVEELQDWVDSHFHAKESLAFVLQPPFPKELADLVLASKEESNTLAKFHRRPHTSQIVTYYFPQAVLKHWFSILSAGQFANWTEMMQQRFLDWFADDLSFKLLNEYLCACYGLHDCQDLVDNREQCLPKQIAKRMRNVLQMSEV